MIPQLKQWLKRLKPVQRDQLAWQFRVGYLHAIDRQLFPDEPPMLAPIEALRMTMDSESFRAGERAGLELCLILPPKHDRSFRDSVTP